MGTEDHLDRISDGVHVHLDTIVHDGYGHSKGKNEEMV
jgi:hypothetical protein